MAHRGFITSKNIPFLCTITLLHLIANYLTLECQAWNCFQTVFPVILGDSLGDTEFKSVAMNPNNNDVSILNF